MRARSDAGFTLIEVLVALVVAALIAAIIGQATVQGARQRQKVLQRQDAVAVARAMMARQAALPFRAGEVQGAEGALHWTIRERPVLNDPRGLLVLADLAIEVRDGGGQILLRAGTRKLKHVPAQ